jgi:PAS domain S-box-containing protein
MQDDAPVNHPHVSPDPPFSSREFLRLIENYGLTGTWGWSFATNTQIWSPGLYRLLGLQPDIVDPSYALLLSLVHPDDRAGLDTPDQIRQFGTLRSHSFRVIRPDGSMRILSSRGETYRTADGRPFAAAGIVLDVTGEKQRERAQGVALKGRQALRDEAGVTLHVFTPGHGGQDAPEWAVLVDLPPDERARWRANLTAGFETGRTFTATGLLARREGGHGPFEMTLVPMRRPDGAITEWIGLAEPIDADSGDTRREASDLDATIEGHHLRAARGLLDWSMTDLAEASHLSFSTVRRLEENPNGAADRSRRAAIAALRAAGIRFAQIDGATVAVAVAKV